MRALAGATDPYILQRWGETHVDRKALYKEDMACRYLTASLDRTLIRPQDVTSVLSGVARNPAGSQLAWRHLRMNWDFLVSQFGAGSFIMGSFIESTTSHFSTEFVYQQVREFSNLLYY